MLKACGLVKRRRHWLNTLSLRLMAYPVGPLRQTTEGFEPMVSHFFVGHHSDIISCMRI